MAILASYRGTWYCHRRRSYARTMKTLPLHVLCLGVILAASSLPGRAIQVDSSLRASLNELPRKCAEYLARLAPYQCAIDSDVIDPASKRVLQRLRSEIKHNGMASSFSQTYSITTSGKLRDELRAVNSKYAFKLARAAGNSDWFIKEVRNSQTFRETDDPYKMMPNGDLVLRGITPYAIHFHWLPDLLSDPGFELTGLRNEVQSDGMVRLEFSYRPQKDSYPPQVPHDGWLLLSPAHSWTVKEFELVERIPQFTKRIRRVNEFDMGSDVPLLRSSTIRTTLQKEAAAASLASLESLSYHFARESVPHSAFTLSAFGFPEPPIAAAEGGISAHVWFFGLAASCALLAAVLRYWARRQMRMRAA
jgi:hypothetical protein